MQQQQHQQDKVILNSDVDDFPQQLLKRMCNTNKCYDFQYQDADNLRENGHKIKQWDKVRLYVYKSSKDGMIRAIKEISFPKLKNLCISEDNLESIEGLARLIAPQLQTLSLDKNKIMCISSLRRIYSQKISMIQLCGNQLAQANSLVEGNWKQLSRLYLKFWAVRSENHCESVAFCAKLAENNSNEYQLWIDGRTRIPEKRLVKRLKRKHQQKKKVQIRTNFVQFDLFDI